MSLDIILMLSSIVYLLSEIIVKFIVDAYREWGTDLHEGALVCIFMLPVLVVADVYFVIALYKEIVG